MFQLLGTATVFLVLGIVAGLFGFGIISEDAPFGAKVLSAVSLWVAAGTFWSARVRSTRFYETPDRSLEQKP